MGLKPHNPRINNMAVGHLQCNQCGYKSNNSEALKYHIRIHTNERPFECEYCGKRSRLKSHNQIHIKRKHTDQGKPHKCVRCGRAFSSPLNLNNHMSREHMIAMAEAKPKTIQTNGYQARKERALFPVLAAQVDPGMTPNSLEEIISATNQWKQRILSEPDLFKPELPLNMVYQDPNYLDPGLRVRVATEVKRSLGMMRRELDTDGSCYIYTLHDPSLTKVPLHRILAAVDQHTRFTGSTLFKPQLTLA